MEGMYDSRRVLLKIDVRRMIAFLGGFFSYFIGYQVVAGGFIVF